MGSTEHKIFEVKLSNNLENLTKYLDEKYEEMKEVNWTDKDRFYDPGNHWLNFNIFHFYHEGIYTLQKAVRDLTKEACEYYNVDFDKQKYYIHGWFNYYPIKVNNNVDPDDLIYHDHGSNIHFPFHGYYCVNAEPSTTYYKINGVRFDNINKNNRAILSQNGFPHAVGEWNEDSNRITIAYNIRPLKQLNHEIKGSGQFIPL